DAKNTAARDSFGVPEMVTNMQRARIARWQQTAVWALALFAVCGWRQALAWTVACVGYALLRGKLEAWSLARLRSADPGGRFTYTAAAVVGASVCAAAPVLAWNSGHAFGHSMALVMLISAYLVTLTQFSSSPRRFLTVTAPYSVVVLGLLTGLTAEGRPVAFLAGMGVLYSAVAFALVYGHIAHRRMRLAQLRQKRLIRALERARDRAQSAEREHAAALNKLREAVAAMPAGLAFYDSDDRLTIWNERYADAGGEFARHLVVGQTFRELCEINVAAGAHPEALGREEEWIEARLAQRRACTEGIEQQFSDGRWFQVEDKRLSDGGTVSIILDITELKRREKTLEQARDQAEAANRAKSDFLAMMSHELRTPMNGVLGMAHALSGTGLEPKQRTYVDTIIRSGDGLMAVLNDILDLSKIEAGKMELAPDTVDMHDLVEQACELWRRGAEDKRLAYGFEIAPDTPRWVKADPTRLRQILLNLISNAIKFTDSGHVRLAVGRAADGAVTLAIQDTGPGIPRSVRAKLFDSFTQADAGVARSHGGTGLGLAISRKLARMMGGDIEIRSRVGRGSTFTVRLPLEETVAPGAAGTAVPEAAPDMLSILVAEDNPTNRAVIRALLESTGWEVHVVEDGSEALEALRTRGFDLVLMDVHMPVMDGVTAVNHIRRGQAGRRDIPVIALTADAMAGDRERLMAEGFDDHVAKPIRPDELLRAILTILAEAFEDEPQALSA
ncbi:MAG TPA: ATP-binding protein, partial [Caulobacteraceae bacterium]|nr:ATP-binding protein [Caulobacteraceae bacterium]